MLRLRDPRHLTVTKVDYPIPSRSIITSQLPLCLFNKLPIGMNDPETRLGSQSGITSLQMNVVYFYEGAKTFKYLNFYVVRQKVRAVGDPDPLLQEVMEVSRTDYSGQEIQPQIAPTAFLKINSASRYELISSKTMIFTEQSKAGYEELLLNLNITSVYSTDPATDDTRDELEKPIEYIYYLYAIADKETNDVNDEDTKVKVTFSYRLCYGVPVQ